MGLSFSAMTLKTACNVASQRLKMKSQKQTQLCKRQRRELASHLQHNNQAKARIEAEKLIPMSAFIPVINTLELQCSLISARIELLASSSTVPREMEEACASVVFAAKHLDVGTPELAEIASQLRKKFGSAWANEQEKENSSKAKPMIKTANIIASPTIEAAHAYMNDVAREHSVAWSPPAVAVTPGNTVESKLVSTAGRSSGSALAHSSSSADEEYGVAGPEHGLEMHGITESNVVLGHPANESEVRVPLDGQGENYGLGEVEEEPEEKAVAGEDDAANALLERALAAHRKQKNKIARWLFLAIGVFTVGMILLYVFVVLRA